MEDPTQITRWQFLQEMRKHPIVVGFVMIGGIFLAALKVLPLFLPPDAAQKISLYPFIPKWDWHVWVIWTLIILLFGFLESWYHFYIHQKREISILENRIKGQERSQDGGNKEAISEMPASRPKIRPVSYSQQSSKDFGAGLIIANDGEPAYDISISDISLGPSTVTITPNFTRLSNEDGEKFCEVWIKAPRGMMLGGGGLLDIMRLQDIGTVVFQIRFKDSDNRCYVTTCKLELDATVLGGTGKVGINARFIGQEIDTVNTTK